MHQVLTLVYVFFPSSSNACVFFAGVFSKFEDWEGKQRIIDVLSNTLCPGFDLDPVSLGFIKVFLVLKALLCYAIFVIIIIIVVVVVVIVAAAMKRMFPHLRVKVAKQWSL